MSTDHLPLRGKPDLPPWGTCDWGRCDQDAVEWRWSRQGWLPVCAAHLTSCEKCDDLRVAIQLHRERVSSLGLNVDRKGNPVHGGEWDRDLWAVLNDGGVA